MTVQCGWATPQVCNTAAKETLLPMPVSKLSQTPSNETEIYSVHHIRKQTDTVCSHLPMTVIGDNGNLWGRKEAEGDCRVSMIFFLLKHGDFKACKIKIIQQKVPALLSGSPAITTPRGFPSLRPLVPPNIRGLNFYSP